MDHLGGLVKAPWMNSWTTSGGGGGLVTAPWKNSWTTLGPSERTVEDNTDAAFQLAVLFYFVGHCSGREQVFDEVDLND